MALKDVFTEMHKRCCFWKLFTRDRANESSKLPKFAEKHFYAALSSFLANLGSKKLFWVISGILGLLLNTLNANYEYSRNNTDNLPLLVQIPLSGKLKTSSQFFIPFFGSVLNFQCFEKKKNSHGSSIS